MVCPRGEEGERKREDEMQRKLDWWKMGRKVMATSKEKGKVRQRRKREKKDNRE